MEGALEDLHERFPCRSESATEARALLRDLAAPLSGPDLHAAGLVVTELVANAIRHGCAGEDDTFEIDIERSAASLRVLVTQSCPLFDASEVLRRPPKELGGWGLVMLDRLCRGWGVDGDRNGVWAELAVNP
ncbi:MAG: ATP-binding protein [Actinomycetota bacterium]